MTQHNTITGETLILGYFYFLQRGHLELDNNLLFKSKPAPTGTFNGEIQTLYDKWKFALIKQKLFRENQPTNKELAQMAGAHKNEKVIFIPTDKGIKFLGHKVVPEKLL